MKLTDDEIQQLQSLVEKATGGQWSIEPHGRGVGLYSGRTEATAGDPWGATHGLRLMQLTDGDSNFTHNVEWLGACSPAKVKALADEVSRAREVQAALQRVIQSLERKREHASDCLARFHPPSTDNSEKGPCFCGAQGYNILTAQMLKRLLPLRDNGDQNS